MEPLPPSNHTFKNTGTGDGVKGSTSFNINGMLPNMRTILKYNNPRKNFASFTSLVLNAAFMLMAGIRSIAILAMVMAL